MQQKCLFVLCLFLLIAKIANGLTVTTEKLNNLPFEIRIFPTLYSFKTALVINVTFIL